ncbi:sugar phosphate isomerase/epimerase family protein [Botrimarina mediterranea]|uniref:Fructoselysine 3-epimerase n=1 Tax=Botrimarina mediterranea TaxID=2528022 RepID=A0A518K6P6_9BACT|nr:sugar phosphate isomerase/epimerase family protein [Botrimarina mediterranea]QDV73469.1 fructoselysine 3-epimerase [Botrimarina mediterranea]QDV77986.1 fructoselysine 3-epimerase [Planctomycetes bacterium K2D]
MNQLTTYRWSFEEDLHHCRHAGYDGIAVWVRKLRDFGEERAAELISDSGLAVSNVSWEGGFTGADAVTSRENLAAARDTLALCGALGAGCLTIYSGGRNGHTSRHANRLLRAALDRLLPFAEEAGVPLAIEPMHPACADDWTIVTSLPDALELVREYDTPALRLALDTYHFPLAEEAWPILRELAGYLAVVHLGDVQTPHSVDHSRAALGEGAAPLAGIVQTLAEAGYAGFFDVKLLGPAFDEADYDRLLRQSREAFVAFGADEIAAVEVAPRDAAAPTPSPIDSCKLIW